MIKYNEFLFSKRGKSMSIAFKEIANGVKLLCIKNEKFKTNCLKVDFYLPINEFFPAQKVLAYLIGQTSKKYNTIKKFNSKVEGLYDMDFDTSISSVGEKIKINFSAEFLDDRFTLDGKSIAEEAVDFIIEILKNPNCEDGKFDENATQREIKFTLERIKAEKNDKKAYALSRLRQLMCKDEPFGIDREKLEDDVAHLDSKMLFDAYEDMLKSSTVVITASGSLDEKMIEDKFTDFVNSIDNRQPAKLDTVFVEKANEIRYFKEKMDVSQAKMVIGMRTGMRDKNDDYVAYRVMTDIFGGGPYSRLFLNVREKMSLCYYCGARLLRDKGIIFIQSGVEEENYEKALKEILNQLEIMKNGEFTDEDFNSSIIALSDAFKGVGDSPVAECVFYGSQAFDDQVVTGKEFAEKIKSVTREQVINCAKRVTVDSVYLLAGEGADNE